MPREEQGGGHFRGLDRQRVRKETGRPAPPLGPGRLGLLTAGQGLLPEASRGEGGDGSSQKGRAGGVGGRGLVATVATSPMFLPPAGKCV